MGGEAGEESAFESMGRSGDHVTQSAKTDAALLGFLKLPSNLDRKMFYASSVGLAFCMAGTSAYLGTSSHTPVALSSLPIDGGLLASYLSSLVALIGTMFTAPVFHRFRRNRLVLSLIAAVMTVGTGLLLIGSQIGLPLSAANISGGVLLGFGSTLLLLRWADYVMPFGTQAATLCLGFAILGAAVVCMLLISLGPIPGVLLALMLPTLSCVLFAMVSKKGASPLVAENTPMQHAEISAPAENPAPALPFWKFCLIIALYVFLLGKTSSQGLASFSELGFLFEFLKKFSVGLGQALGALLVISGAKFLRDDGEGFRRQAIFPLVIVALYLSTLLGGIWGSLYSILNFAAQQLLYGFVWATLSSKTFRQNRSVLLAFSQSYFFLVAAGTCSLIVNAVLKRSGAVSISYTLMIAFILLILVLLEFGPLLTGRAQSASRPPRTSLLPDRLSDGDGVDNLITRQCSLVMEKNGLTPRERDILPLLARGHTVAHIAETLSIGQETVKTHIRSIYQKTNVRSKEELIGLVETTVPM
ncbi:MAG: response regulator transcription factor [Coriobacteriia bacterium]